MANTFSQIYIQVVFAVKGRQSLIHKDWKDELYKYICGTVSAKTQKVYAIGGVADHIHILISIKPNIDVSSLVGEIKANSTKWINTRKFTQQRFSWQEGFGAFSYSHSHLDRVIAYVNNQEEHQKKQTFKDEYVGLLKKFEMSYEEEYLFVWVD
jgi:putative transposase